MEGKYKFDEGKYQNTFGQMFGSNAFANGMAEAELLGRTSAEVEFAKQLYLDRLKAAEEAAYRRSRGGGGDGYGYSSGSGTKGRLSTGNPLADEFLKEKRANQLSPLETYNQQTKKNTGASVVSNMPVVPIAKNRSLSAYDQMKLVQADAAYQSKLRR